MFAKDHISIQVDDHDRDDELLLPKVLTRYQHYLKFNDAELKKSS